MEEFIINETKKIFNKAIKKFSKNDKVEQEEVSILLYLKEEDGERVTGYKVCHHHQPVRETKMMEILGVLIDLKGYSMLVPPQIKKIIENFESELHSKNVEVCVYLDREEDSEVRYFSILSSLLYSLITLLTVSQFDCSNPPAMLYISFRWYFRFLNSLNGTPANRYL